MAEHWTKAIRDEVAALRAEVAALRDSRATVGEAQGFTVVNADYAQARTSTTNDPDREAFYRALIVGLASSQGMGAFNPDSLAGVKANAGAAWLLLRDLCANHDAAINAAHERDARVKQQEADLQAQIAANQAARLLRRQRASATQGQVTVQTPVAGANGLSRDESALVAAAMAMGVVPSPDGA